MSYSPFRKLDYLRIYMLISICALHKSADTQMPFLIPKWNSQLIDFFIALRWNHVLIFSRGKLKTRINLKIWQFVISNNIIRELLILSDYGWPCLETTIRRNWCLNHCMIAPALCCDLAKVFQVIHHVYNMPLRARFKSLINASMPAI